MNIICNGLHFLTLIVYLCTDISDGAKILGFFPTFSPSHVLLGRALLKGLAKQGHEVTMVSTFPQNKSIENYTDLAIESMKPVVQDFLKKNVGFTNYFDMYYDNIYQKIVVAYGFGLQLTEAAFKDPTVKKLLSSNEKFDVIILCTFLNEAHYVLADIFKAPVIAFSTVGLSAWTNDLAANPSPYAYVPDANLEYTDQMTFPQRLKNTLVSFGNEMYRYFVYLPLQEAIMRKYFPGSPDLNTLLQNTSLVLVNSHVSLSYPRPLSHKIIEIGGLHLDRPSKLPDELQEYLDRAVEGVVYFSMGSNLESMHLPVEFRTCLLKAFGRLKQKVLWKWEADNLPGQPENVRVGKWLPQQAILAHPNVKVFITHGGFLSTTEAVYFGVPIIGIPIYSDQQKNMGHAIKDGYGLQLEFNEITEDSVYNVIQEILTNPKYTQNVLHRGVILHDQQIHPLQKAIFWVEYVIRHKGAPHLQSAVIHLNRFQYLLLDVIAALVLVLILFIATITYIINKCLNSNHSVDKLNKKIK